MTFPTEAWLRAVLDAANRHPDLRDALRGLPPDLAAVIEAEPPGFPRDFAAYGRQANGRFEAPRILEDPDDILELEPAYVVRAPYRVWKSILRGEDPIQSALSGRLRVTGDLQALVRRAKYRYIVEAALAAVPTTFSDEGGRR